jgi:hypothetical protein
MAEGYKVISPTRKIYRNTRADDMDSRSIAGMPAFSDFLDEKAS